MNENTAYQSLLGLSLYFFYVKVAKKVGTLIGDEEDITTRRKRLSTAALAKLQNIWIKGDKVKRKTKIKLYRTLVKSVLT